MIEDGASDQGSVTTVRRVGDTIRRPVGEWTLAVHALLEHLETAGFDRAPRALGVDGQEEVLSLLHGDPAFKPWPSCLRSADGLVQLGHWLRDYHEAVRDFRPSPDARWRQYDGEWKPGMVIRHGDLGPWNSIWDGDRLTGFIDWDFAAPGHAVDDLAQLAWYAVPLRPADPGRAPDAAARTRLAVLCSAYGARPGAVLDALEELQEREAGRIRRLGAKGLEPWAGFLARGDTDEMREEGHWLRENRGALLGGE
ncbi:MULTISPECIES: phosphotransferase [unclassified Streptomyces]|uniref:phosphotransferase n=1 Tax=unclassified Streptomyces TaxID=2593676 RepID=UPI000933D5A4|nr:phosphotransferase [Streptomyces sp. NBRC 110465]